MHIIHKYLLIIALVGSLLSFVVYKINFLFRSPSPQIRIGLVYTPASIYHEQVHGALLACIKKDSRFSVQDFAIATITDPILVSSVCELALESEADVLICTGFNSTQTLANLSQKRNNKKSVVFLGISEPVERGIVESLERPGKNITGVQSIPVNATFNPIELLLYAKPSVKRILLPYLVAAGGNEQKAHDAQKIAAAKGVTVTLLPINNVSETLLHVTSGLPGHDALMYIEADGVGHHGISFGKLATQHNITMFAGSIDGISEAALGYTSTPNCLAITAFELAKEITLNKISPSIIPIADSTGHRELIINTDLCAQQDLKDINIVAISAAIKNDPQLAVVHDHITIQNSH